MASLQRDPDDSELDQSKKPPPRKHPADWPDKVIAFVESRKKYWPMTLRGVHYGLVNALPGYQNTRYEYQWLSRELTAAREDGRLDPDAMEDESRIREHGLIHPILVRDKNELVAGARRLAACAELGWKKVPVRRVDRMSDEELRAIEMDENTERVARSPPASTTPSRRIVGQDAVPPKDAIRILHNKPTSPSRHSGCPPPPPGSGCAWCRPTAPSRRREVRWCGGTHREYEACFVFAFLPTETVEGARREPPGLPRGRHRGKGYPRPSPRLRRA